MKILVTGGTGLVGNAINEIHNQYNNYKFIFLSSKDGDLCIINNVDNIFKKEQPDIVIHLAAYVGGLYKNLNDNAKMYEKNIQINTNVLSCCVKYNVKKVVNCLSTCIFPDKTNYPIDETMLHDGPPHYSNEGYSYSKRMLEVHNRLIRKQYSRNFISVIPTNIYGPYDNFKLQEAHVIPSLIHKCYLSKKENKPFIVMGSGKPLRQFIYSIDLAKLIMWAVENYNDDEPIILSPNEDDEISIGNVAKIIAKEFSINDIQFQPEFSDGQYKKTADNTKLIKRIQKFNFTPIEYGIRQTVKWFCKNYNNNNTRI